MNTIEKRRAFIINTFYFVLVGALILATFKYLVPWLMPFILGYLIALLFKPVVNLLVKHTPIHKRMAGFIVVVVGYGILVLLFILLSSRLFSAGKSLVSSLPVFYAQTLQPGLASLNEFISGLLGRISPDLIYSTETVFDQILIYIQNSLSSVSSTALSWLGSTTSKIPSFLLSLIFTIMSSIIISMGHEEITAFLVRQIPRRYSRLVDEIRLHTAGTVGKYLKAYLILMSMTFVELSIGLSVLRVKNSILLALLIALIDILPVFGCGTILLPWVAIELARMNFPLAVGLLTLYGIITLVRNIVEPRVVGDQLGLHPLVTIVCIYIGFRTIGVGGMILFPIITQTVVSLFKDGVLQFKKEEPDSESPTEVI
ncbi:sporulation integral membrane protein YtvI [Oscillospiraceae bacterium MB08-C2-2]|nr:sporulation integral membrane protein YtvI [Oscillospiraceae bacterium MB08-C2-2]